VVNAQPPCSIKDAVEWLRKAFRAESAADLRITYQFDLSGARGGALWVRVECGRLVLAEGTIAGPDVIFRLRADDFYGVLSGRENPDLLFMEERLVVEGDLSRALALRRIFQARI
jgi:predicted lipid carrier protein YhbT